MAVTCVPRAKAVTVPAGGSWDQAAAESAVVPGDYEGRYRTTPPSAGQANSTVWPTKPNTEDQQPQVLKTSNRQYYGPVPVVKTSTQSSSDQRRKCQVSHLPNKWGCLLLHIPVQV